MEIYQAGNERMPVQHDTFARLELYVYLIAGQDCANHALVNCNGMIMKHCTCGLNRDYPARLQQGINFYRIHHHRRSLAKKNPAATAGSDFFVFFVCESNYCIVSFIVSLVPATSTSTRRSGCRHAIRALVLLLPLQVSPVTGSASPLPSMKMRSAGMPFSLTR